ncbi:MAG TPA: glycoside hydrolase [Prolixibacteraceae bacterium]|nr:glycoside hydrolase [Prolixibacteraceae bacterium]
MKRLLFIVLLFTVWSGSSQTLAGLPPLKVSGNGSYLTAGNQPFFWLADTGWLLFGKLNPAETVKYFDDRKQKGFNVIQVMILHSLSQTSYKGDSALIRGDVSRPNPSGYWNYVDEVLRLAEDRGLYLAMVPVWGSNVKAGLVNSAQAAKYAEFLAQRYKDKSNIIWLNGGDVRGSDSIQVWLTIGKTLKKFAPNQLITFHPFGRTQSSTWFHNEQWLDFNMFQSGHRRYDQDTARNETRYGEDNWRYLQADYSKKPVKPTLDGEPSYEGIPQGLHDTLQPKWTADDLRRYAYWSVFSGGCGFTYGNNSVMQFYKPDGKPGAYGARQPWNDAINAPGAQQMIHLKNLMQKYGFENLVPRDELILEQGERYHHQSTLAGKNCLLIYTWNGRQVKIDWSKWKNKVWQARWYDPRSGNFSTANFTSGENILEFDPPGNEVNGNDWVLVIESIKH